MVPPGPGEEAALGSLADYAPRYFRAVQAPLPPGPPQILGVIEGGATTDFGAPGTPSPWDQEPLDPSELERLVRLAEACWDYFDGVLEAAPPQLTRGPRGGGRDRDQIADHVREAERAYARRQGVALAPGTPWGEQRRRLPAAWRTGQQQGAWPIRYGIRRCAWHVLDHAWEVEDRAR